MERKHITQPTDWWAEFDLLAKSAGMSLSEWMGEACKAQMTKADAKRLSARPPAHRPKSVDQGK